MRNVSRYRRLPEAERSAVRSHHANVGQCILVGSCGKLDRSCLGADEGITHAFVAESSPVHPPMVVSNCHHRRESAGVDESAVVVRSSGICLRWVELTSSLWLCDRLGEEYLAGKATARGRAADEILPKGDFAGL